MTSERRKFGRALPFSVLFAALMVVSIGIVSATPIYVPDDYAKIQWAVDNATAGDTIIVNSGTYYENVNVSKQLILRGVDTGSGKPVVDAGGSGSAITLSGGEITIEGFTTTNSSCTLGIAGIEVTSSNNTITGNNASNNGCRGIILMDSCNNTITGNNVSSNGWYGILILESCNNNTIIGNNVSSNYDVGIWFHLNNNNNTITGNNVSNNGWYGICIFESCNNNTITGNTFVNDGLGVYDSYQNTIEDNTVNGKPILFLEDASDIVVTDAGEVFGQVIFVHCNNITIENLDLSNTGGGVQLVSTEDSTISNNNISNNGVGIHFTSSSNNSITSNNASNTKGGSGICLYKSCNNNIITSNAVNNNGLGGICIRLNSNNNIVTGNTVSNNSGGSGIMIYPDYNSSCNNNTIYHNNLINNIENAYDPYTNQWNSTTAGNYYSDYTGNDSNGDGIGDEPHPIPGGSNMDYHPLMEPWHEPQIRGDLNGDGEITPADAAIALQIAVSGEWRADADVSGDGRVTSIDALMILQAAVGKISL